MHFNIGPTLAPKNTVKKVQVKSGMSQILFKFLSSECFCVCAWGVVCMHACLFSYHCVDYSFLNQMISMTTPYTDRKPS